MTDPIIATGEALNLLAELDKLMRLALDATPGERVVRHPGTFDSIQFTQSDGHNLVSSHEALFWASAADRDFVAACSREVILGLIDLARAGIASAAEMSTHAAWELGYASGYDDREKMDHDRTDVIKTENPFTLPEQP